MIMIRAILFPSIFLLVPSITEAGNCIVFFQSAKSAETLSKHHQECVSAEMGNDLSDVFRLINSQKIKKTSPSSGAHFFGSTVQSIRPPKKITPARNIMVRIPSIFPATVLRI
jgi:hypothetical protein